MHIYEGQVWVNFSFQSYVEISISTRSGKLTGCIHKFTLKQYTSTGIISHMHSTSKWLWFWALCCFSCFQLQPSQYWWYIWHMVIIASTDIFVPSKARPSVDAALTTKMALYLFSSMPPYEALFSLNLACLSVILNIFLRTKHIFLAMNWYE